MSYRSAPTPNPPTSGPHSRWSLARARLRIHADVVRLLVWLGLFVTTALGAPYVPAAYWVVLAGVPTLFGFGWGIGFLADAGLYRVEHADDD